MKRLGLLSILLCFCILFCGCQQVLDDGSSNLSSTEVSEQNSYNMHLLYDLTDSFNPFTASGKQNKEICQLLYDPLVALDHNFSPALRVASSVHLSEKVCTVSLRQINFTDGSALTAEDVVYSMRLAMASKNYGAQLKTVSSVQTAGITTVSIYLTKSDPYFTNLLDFPIIKKDSDKRKSDDNISLPPIGCGRYILNEQQTALFSNENYYGEKMSVKSIGLINAPDSESADHYVSAGAVSMCYDDYSDNTVPRMSGLKRSVPLNNLVYLGINMQNPFLRDKYFRYAIASAINRSDIVGDAYYGNGTVANGIFNPRFTAASGFQTLENVNNNKIAIENLEKIGYNNLDNEGYRVTSTGKRITLSLLTNSDNQARVATAQLIKRQLGDVGIEINIKSVPYAQYLSSLSSRSFDLYIAETQLLNNMDISELVTPGGSMAYGIVKPAAPSEETTSSKSDESVENTEPQKPLDINLTAAAAVKGFYEGKYTLGDIATACLSEMPIVPLMYRSGVVMFSPKLKAEPVCTVSDLFYNINQFTF